MQKVRQFTQDCRLSQAETAAAEMKLNPFSGN